jgi:hypothetical protein
MSHRQLLAFVSRTLLLPLLGGAALTLAAPLDPQVDDVAQRERFGLRLDLLADLAEADLAVHGSVRSTLTFARDGLVSVLFATELSASASVVDAIERWEGRIQFRDDKVGYVRAWISAARWPEARSLPHVLAAQLDGRRMLTGGWAETGENLASYLEADAPSVPRPVPAAAGAASASAAKPASEALPQLSAQDLAAPLIDAETALGLDAFTAEHPTYDGRGVTIAIVEPDASSVMADHPALAQALALDGTPRAKIADRVQDPDATWQHIALPEQIDASETLVRIDDAVYTLPGAGVFRWGQLHLAERTYGVLSSPASGQVWVDVNQDRNFQNDPPLEDGRVTRRVGQFPHECGWSGGQFIVMLSEAGHDVSIVPLGARHPMMVASVAAGSQTPGNLALGIAPAARLLFVDVGSTSTHAALEALLRAAQHPDVDIISVSTVLTDTRPMSDEEVSGLIVDRMIRVYGKPIIVSAGNSHEADTTRRAAAALPLTVGAALLPSIARRYFGLADAVSLRVWDYSSRGPRSDGRGLPDVVAPNNVIAAIPCDDTFTYYRRWTTFELPSCHMLSGGTSAAAPAIAGLAARLLSGAKQRGFSVTPEELAWALRSSGKAIPGARAMDQGSGIPQADVAWGLLAGTYRPPAITGWSTLTHPLADYRRSPAVGVSLYEREGWIVGRRETRPVTLLRLDGSNAPRRYVVSWMGNDGTFDAARTIVLPRGRAVTLPVTITARSAGFHNAMLRLSEEIGQTPVHQQQLTVAVADALEQASGHHLRYAADLPPLGRGEHIVRIPAGLHALRVRVLMKGAQLGSSGHIWFQDPRGYVYDRPIERYSYLGFPAGESVEFTIPDPEPGTWLLTVVALENAQRSAAFSYELELTGHRVRMSAESSTRNAGEIRVQVDNVGAMLQPFQPVVELAQVERQAGRFSRLRQPLVMPFQIAADATSLAVSASTPDSVCGLQLYLYDCTSGSCRRHDAGIPAASFRSARMISPTPGLWKAVLTPGPACGESERVLFETQTMRPGLGSVVPTSDTALPEALATGQRWTGTYRVQPAPAKPDAELALLFNPEPMTPAPSSSSADNPATRRPNKMTAFGYAVPIGRLLTSTAVSRRP